MMDILFILRINNNYNVLFHCAIISFKCVINNLEKLIRYYDLDS